MPSPIQQTSPEDVFAKHYDWLLGWAEYFTRGQLDQAEDLVHELFIQFLRVAPELDSDESAKPYLYRSLHNLFLANLSRNSRTRHHQLSVYEYDSFRIGISSIDRSSLISVREDLWLICKYACQRKSNLRAASYFILRFFLEYSPGQIIALAGTTRAAFDKNIQLMRDEVRSHFNGHASFPATRRKLPEDIAFGSAQYDATDLFQQIFRLIHSHVHNSCLQPDDIPQLYSVDKAVDTPIMAHLVSCRECRELCMRYIDRSGKSPGSSSHVQEITHNRKDFSSIRRAGNDNLDRLRQKYRENFEHRPAYLYLAIAGKTEASQRITSASNELGASVPFTDSPVFLDITSEQGVRLLSLLLDDDYNRFPKDVKASTPLSDGRSLQIEASSSGGSLSVLATYFDPVVDRNDEEDVAAFYPASVHSADEIKLTPEESRLAGLMVRARQLLSGLYWPHLAAATTALTILLLILIPSVHRSYTRRRALSALEQMHEAEKALMNAHDVHRVGIFQMEVPGISIPDRRIEVWQSGTPAHLAARLYMEDGRLQGTSPENDPSRTDYNQPEDIWRSGFSTATAEKVIRDGTVEMSESPQGILRITARNGARRPVHGIVEAVVLVDRTNNLVIEQAFVIRNEDREYHCRLVETRFEVAPRGQFKPEVFPSDPVTSRSSGMVHAPIHPRTDRAGLESIASQHVDALWALHQAGNEKGEQFEVQRRANAIEISGVVTTVRRRYFLSNSLLTVCPACKLHIEIASTHRSTLRKNAVSQITVQTADDASASSDVEDLLRPALIARGYDPAQLRQYATERALDLIDIAAQLVRDTDALEKDASCCSSAELRTLSSTHQLLWTRLLSTQLDQTDKSLTFLQEKLDALNTASGLLLHPEAPAVTPQSGDGRAQVEHLHRLAIALQLSLLDFGAAKRGTEQDAIPQWHQLLTQAAELRQQLDVTRSFVNSPR